MAKRIHGLHGWLAGQEGTRLCQGGRIPGLQMCIVRTTAEAWVCGLLRPASSHAGFTQRLRRRAEEVKSAELVAVYLL